MAEEDAPPEPPTSPLEDMAELLDSLRSTGSRGELTDSDELQEYCKQVGGRASTKAGTSKAIMFGH